ncbi:MAG: hypothetical protein MHPSP_001350, partial [Paramarteilia canceri]
MRSAKKRMSRATSRDSSSFRNSQSESADFLFTNIQLPASATAKKSRNVNAYDTANNLQIVENDKLTLLELDSQDPTRALARNESTKKTGYVQSHL